MSDMLGLARLVGWPIVETVGLRDGQVIVSHDLAGSAVIFVGTRPLTELELAGREARLIVRDGLADVLAWLGWPNDREPLGIARLLRGLAEPEPRAG